MPRLHPAPLAAAVLLAGCSLFPRGPQYPLVPTSIGSALVAGADSGWVLGGDGGAVVARDRDALEDPSTALAGAARAFRNLLDELPPPVTVVVVPRDSLQAPPTLPESLAARPVLRVFASPSEEELRRRRGPRRAHARAALGRVAPTPSMLAGDAARRWTRDLMAGAPGSAAASEGGWLDAAIVAWVGMPGLDGLAARIASGRMRRDADAMRLVPLDTLFARRCPRGPADGALPAVEDVRDDEQRPGDVLVGGMQRRRERGPSNAGCDIAFAAQSLSLLQFLVQREGRGIARELVEATRAGRPVAVLLPGRKMIPATVAELETAWRAWLRDQGR